MMRFTLLCCFIPALLFAQHEIVTISYEPFFFKGSVNEITHEREGKWNLLSNDSIVIFSITYKKDLLHGKTTFQFGDSALTQVFHKGYPLIFEWGKVNKFIYFRKQRYDYTKAWARVYPDFGLIFLPVENFVLGLKIKNLFTKLSLTIQHGRKWRKSDDFFYYSPHYFNKPLIIIDKLNGKEPQYRLKFQTDFK